jgi:hypothetical protein
MAGLKALFPRVGSLGWRAEDDGDPRDRFDGEDFNGQL